MVYYGPDDKHASKAAIGIVEFEWADPQMTRLFSEQGARTDRTILAQILELLHTHGVKSVVSTERILGCPHEEGIDYPDGEVCPQCPFWAHRDRFTGDLIQ